jgi:hypothetical protein
LSIVGHFVPGITEDNLMAAWQSVFGDVAERRIASRDKNPDNQNTKGIWVAFTRKPSSIPIWALWEMMVRAGGSCYPSLNFWSGLTGTDQMHGIDALIDLTTVRKEIAYPELWQTTILELLGKRWELDEPPIFYQAAPASMQNQAYQNRRLSDNNTNRLSNRRTNCIRRRQPDGSKHHAGVRLSNRHSLHPTEYEEMKEHKSRERWTWQLGTR